jgi:hypothetical protein
MTIKGTTLPNAQLLEALQQEVLGSTAPSQPVAETSTDISASQRETTMTGGTGSASACCGPTVQQSCCEPAAKAACCGVPATPGSCGCQ